MLLGIFLVTAGIFMSIYTCINPVMQNEWYIWALLVSLLINTGLLLLFKAFVHKVKADLIRKQKNHEQHKTFTAD